MRSSNIPYLGALDQLRGVAAMWIAVYHTVHILGRQMQFGAPYQLDKAQQLPGTSDPLLGVILQGHTAVALFMVMSGFIFSYGGYGRHVAYLPFIRNRVLRIYPLFIVLLAFGVFTSGKPVRLAAILQTIIPFGWNQGNLPLPWTPFSAMFWSLVIECQFYLVFPLLFAIASHSGYFQVPALLIAAFVALRFLAWSFGADATNITYWSIVGRMDYFLIGMAAGFLHAQDHLPARFWRLAFVPTALLVLASIILYHEFGGFGVKSAWRILQPPAEGLLWGAFVLSYIHAASRLPKIIGRSLEMVGTVSYSIYMMHISIIWLICKRVWYFRTDFGLFPDIFLNYVAVVLPLTLVLATLTYHAIEKPFLALRGKYVS